MTRASVYPNKFWRSAIGAAILNGPFALGLSIVNRIARTKSLM